MKSSLKVTRLLFITSLALSCAADAGPAVAAVEVALPGESLRDIAEVNVSQLDTSQFPIIDMYVDVIDLDGNPISGLTHADFCLYQDGVRIPFQVLEFGGDCAVSVSLLMDKSGSMDEEIGDAIYAAHTFIDLMSPFDRVQILAYSDCVYLLRDFTSDKASLHEAIDLLSAGGQTALTDGFYAATAMTCTELGAKAVIGFTDGKENNSHVCWLPPDGGSTEEDVVDDCIMVRYMAALCGMPIFSIGLGSDVWSELLLCLATSPAYAFHAPDVADLQLIYNEIKSDLCSRYLIAFRSPDPVLSGEYHRVDVCAGGSTVCTPCGRKMYLENHAPKIVRVGYTMDLSDGCQPHGQAFDIIATIHDAAEPLLYGASLFYRAIGSGEFFTDVPMTSLDGDIYYASIPASLVPEPPPAGPAGIDYYIVATDFYNTVGDPPRNSWIQPYQITICPNAFPELVHTPVAQACPDTELTVHAEITDPVEAIYYVFLFARQGGQVLYTPFIMDPAGGDMWAGTIPAYYINELLGADYYLQSCDESGTCTYSGRAHAPHHINPVCCPDLDEDGYDICAPGDEGDDGLLADCDDTAPLVRPGAVELCADGIDNDCDGLIDAEDPGCEDCPYFTYTSERITAAIDADGQAQLWLEEHGAVPIDPAEYLAILQGALTEKADARESIALTLDTCTLEPDEEILSGMVDYMLESAELLEGYAITVMDDPTSWEERVASAQLYLADSVDVLTLTLDILVW